MNPADSPPRAITCKQSQNRAPEESSPLLCSSLLGLEIWLLGNGKYRAHLQDSAHWSRDFPSATAAVIGGLAWLHGQTDEAPGR